MAVNKVAAFALETTLFATGYGLEHYSMIHRFTRTVREQHTECVEKSGFIYHKGHEFIPLFYHFPANCEACTKPLWNMFKPPLALECQRCQIKCHKEHMDKKEEDLRPCTPDRFDPQFTTG